MKVLIACEESQRVCVEFRKRGHEAYSCDIEPCSGGHPEWHIQQDVTELLKMDWDLIIAHPPCTFLTVTGNRWFDVGKYGEKARERERERERAAEFFMRFWNCKCKRVVIENPIGFMSTHFRKPDQIIQPFQFGDAARKATCLWMRGVPLLVPTNIVEPVIIKYKNGKGTDNPWHMESLRIPPKERAKFRSKTFPGIAKAMAEQWG